LQGIPSPPSSPPLAATHSKAAARRGGAAYTITGECERLFCETLRSVFLGEGSQTRQDSLVMGMYNVDDYGVKPREADLHAEEHGHGNITDWIEMWDYVGGIRFRGFVAEKKDEKAMFVFFDQSVVVGDLKAG
tara:strand:- start:23131 stop:23529 length:399 start_codon:yes stop_codon:yes gene_type:complete